MHRQAIQSDSMKEHTPGHFSDSTFLPLCVSRGQYMIYQKWPQSDSLVLQYAMQFPSLHQHRRMVALPAQILKSPSTTPPDPVNRHTSLTCLLRLALRFSRHSSHREIRATPLGSGQSPLFYLSGKSVSAVPRITYPRRYHKASINPPASRPRSRASPRAPSISAPSLLLNRMLTQRRKPGEMSTKSLRPGNPQIEAHAHAPRSLDRVDPSVHAQCSVLCSRACLNAPAPAGFARLRRLYVRFRDDTLLVSLYSCIRVLVYPCIDWAGQGSMQSIWGTGVLPPNWGCCSLRLRLGSGLVAPAVCVRRTVEPRCNIIGGIEMDVSMWFVIEEFLRRDPTRHTHWSRRGSRLSSGQAQCRGAGVFTYSSCSGGAIRTRAVGRFDKKTACRNPGTGGNSHTTPYSDSGCTHTFVFVLVFGAHHLRRAPAGNARMEGRGAGTITVFSWRPPACGRRAD